ncbi:DegV domain-containing protein SAV1425 [Aedoeadaptatus ivorii]|uniref:DegV domain-containing protein SAV1425 n=1 Tax=Aedoeadaptatus ivorii TaxID=54006 RepID=A0A3S4YUV1_9FIRM|nr:DegV family protein [Peptoniphilus ivorii]MDQ0508064.1 DegV family protein with EDD domain [Peptoniphilus ivorii]VEJ34987.1 DegV domain-containing protein SAV1425 [Peptoniphilus ivorii]
MSSYQILTDGAQDLYPELFHSTNIRRIPMRTACGGRDFEIGDDTTRDDILTFYRLLKEQPAYTSQISPGIYEHYFEQYLEKGLDVLYLCMSGGISMQFHQSEVAAKLLQARYPERTIRCLDTRTCTAGGNLICARAEANQAAGMDLSENFDDLESFKAHIGLYGIVTELDHLHRGGRLSSVGALVGNALNIKPFLHMRDDGVLAIREKVRGAKNATKTLARTAGEDPDPAHRICYLSHADNEALCEEVKKLILEKTEIETVYTGLLNPIIGSHLGSGGISMAVLCAKPVS